MADTISSLELQITSSSQSAVSGLDKLASSLGRLKTATQGGLGLTSVVKQLDSVNTALSNMSAGGVTKLSSLAKAIDLLNGKKISPTIGKQITEISTALASADFSSGNAKMTELVEALRPLETLGKSSLGTTVNALKKLPEVLNKIDTRRLYTQIDSLTRIFRPLATEMDKIAKGFSAFPSRIQKLIAGNEKLTNSNGKVAKSNDKSAMSFLAFVAKVKIAINVVKKVYSVISSLVKKINEYIESMNLFNASMGEYASEAQGYAEKVGEVMGIDPGEWMRNQGVFMTLATGFGVAGDRAAVMSQQLTQLGYDLSSFFNISVEESMQKLQSGISGELEPLRRLGYDLSQAKLEATALSLGIDKSVSSMTQAEKAQLRYYAIMTQVTVAQGDMGRTLHAPANQLRIMKAQLDQAGRAIGSIFIPALNAVLPYCIAVTKVVREMASAFASLVGFEMPEVDYSGLESVAGGADDALEDAADSAKKLKSHMMGFDELNVLGNDSDDGEDAASQFEFELPTYDFLGEAVDSRIEGITSRIYDLLSPLEEVGKMFSEWGKGLNTEPLVTSFGELARSTGDVVGNIGSIIGLLLEITALPILKWLIESFLPTFNTSLSSINTAIATILPYIEEGVAYLGEKLAPIFEWVGGVILIAIGEISSLFGKLATLFEEKGGKITNIFKGIGDIIGVIWGVLKPILDFIMPILKALVDFISTNLVNAIGVVIDAVSGIIDVIAGIFTGDGDRIKQGFESIFGGLAEFGAKTWDALCQLLAPVAQWVGDKVVTPIVEWFSGMKQKVFDFFKGLWDGICGVWNTAATWFNDKVIKPIVNFFNPIKERISAIFKGCWILIQAVWLVVSAWFDEHVIQPVVGFFKGLWETVSGHFSELWNAIVAIWNGVADWFDKHVTEPVIKFFKGVWDKVSGYFTKLWGDVKGVWNTVSTWFSETVIEPVKTAFDTACQKIEGFFSGLWLGLKRGVVGTMNAIIGAIEKAINWIVGGINGLISGFNDVVKWGADIIGADWGGVTLLGTVKLERIQMPAYADGAYGIPNGQMFIAREAGAEMVGAIGNKTTVANNEQIVSGIAHGVAEANGEQNILLREQNSLLRALLEKDSGVYLDGKSLTNSVEKYQSERGRVLLTGGAY